MFFYSAAYKIILNRCVRVQLFQINYLVEGKNWTTALKNGCFYLNIPFCQRSAEAAK